eukprot:CAMPEP_0176298170 /NCGR_PEP_ID=MMETSP0121_2-20121125/59113_1 /TAXON_ID=160619 /ORGANISM="Kryptoperidinium foliaceum, Strain CCMP 1326" /LENGTH=49 /DNA_ID= /DNA_START= /DNA_END= /DNA_ORIENTATION=
MVDGRAEEELLCALAPRRHGVKSARLGSTASRLGRLAPATGGRQRAPKD